MAGGTKKEGEENEENENGPPAPGPAPKRGSKEELAQLKRQFHADLLQLNPTARPEGEKPGTAAAAWWGQMASYNSYRLSVAMQLMEALVERMSERMERMDQEVKDLKIELGKTRALVQKNPPQPKQPNQKAPAAAAPPGNQQTGNGVQAPNPNLGQLSYSQITGTNAGPPGPVFQIFDPKKEKREKAIQKDEERCSKEVVLHNVPMKDDHQEDKQSMMDHIHKIAPQFDTNLCERYTRQYNSKAVPKPILLVFKANKGREDFIGLADAAGYTEFREDDFWVRKGRTRTERSEKKQARDKWFKKSDPEKAFLKTHSGKF